MKTLTLKIAMLCLLVPVAAFAGIRKGKYTKEKKISKSYNVSADAGLYVKNKYGNIYVTTWSENKIAVDVVITISGNNEDTVNKRINSIDINFSDTASLVQAETVFGKFSGNNINMEINYTIKIPEKGGVKLDNQYGDIALGKINGESALRCKYGDIKIDALNSTDNEIDIEYCDGSKIGTVNSAKISARYSDLNITKANNLKLTCNYTDLEVGSIDNITYTAEYGDVNIKKGNNIVGNGNYQDITVGSVTGQLNLTTNYGDVKVQNVNSGVKNIAITTTYSDVTVFYSSDYAFDFEFNLNYSDFNGKSGLTIQDKKEGNTGSYYKGYYKSQGTNRMYISTSYGDLKLGRN